MPDSESNSKNPSRARSHREPRDRASAVEQTPASSGPELQDTHLPWAPALGGDFGSGTFEHHATVLGDSRLSQPMYARQRALLVQKLQRDYGHRYVQRLADHIAQTRAADGSPVARQPATDQGSPEAGDANAKSPTADNSSLNGASTIQTYNQSLSAPGQPTASSPEGNQPLAQASVPGVSQNGLYPTGPASGANGSPRPTIARAAAPPTAEDVDAPEADLEAKEPVAEGAAAAPQAIPEAPPGEDEVAGAPPVVEEQSPAAPEPSAAEDMLPGPATVDAIDGPAPADPTEDSDQVVQGPSEEAAEGESEEEAESSEELAPEPGAGVEASAAEEGPTGAQELAADGETPAGLDPQGLEEEGEPQEAAPSSGEGEVGANLEESPPSPEEDPGFQAVASRTRGAAAQERAHAPAQAESAAAQAAAEGPANEVSSLAEAEQVQEMDQQQPQPFDRAAFKATLKQKIERTAPKTLEDADSSKGNDRLASVKSDVSGEVEKSKEESQGGIEEKTQETPDTGGIEPKPTMPLHPPEAGPPPPDLGAAQAIPQPKSDATVVTPFQEGSQELDQEMAGAEITEAQLANSNEPEFQSALQAKQEAQSDAAQAPAVYREQEQGVLTDARSDAEGMAVAQTAGMHADREQLLSQVAGEQEQAKSEDESERAAVAKYIESVYQKTRDAVEARLAKLDKDVEQAFDRGAEQARQAFDSYQKREMRAYKKRRYSGLRGKARWVRDRFRSLPDEVNQIYVAGRNQYLAAMDGVIDQVAGIVEVGLTEAKAIIAQGRQEIQDYVSGLPESLQSVGQEAAANIQDRFDALEQSVDDKQNELVDSLAEKYNESLQAVDAQIEKLKEANRGLLDRALDAVVGVARTIMQLKDMLLNVLGKAAAVIGGIIKDPIGFVGNLVSAVKQGLDNFVSKIGGYLKEGLINWLTGAIASAGITLPDTWDLKGIFSLVMQILGFTYNAVRALAVKALGEDVVSALEKTFEIFKILATEGVAGLWNFIKDKVGDLQTMVMDKIKDMVITQVIQAGVKWIIGLLNPASAFIKAAMAIYDIIKFFITRGKQVMELVNAVLDSVGAIAKGNLGGAAQMVEQALAKGVPVVIGFLASLLGLGDIGTKVRAIFEAVQEPIKKGISWVLEQAKAAAKGLGRMLGFGKDAEGEENVASEGEEVDATDHLAVVRHVIQQLESMEVNGGYLETRAAAEEKSKALESYWSSRLEPGIGITITLSPSEAESSEKDIDFRVIIAPNNAEGTGSVSTDEEECPSPGRSAPGIGETAVHGAQPPRNYDGPRVHHTQSEHIIPFATARSLRLAVGFTERSRIVLSKFDRGMITLMIYRGAAEGKNSQDNVYSAQFESDMEAAKVKEKTQQARQQYEGGNITGGESLGREVVSAVTGAMETLRLSAVRRTQQEILAEWAFVEPGCTDTNGQRRGEEKPVPSDPIVEQTADRQLDGIIDLVRDALLAATLQEAEQPSWEGLSINESSVYNRLLQAGYQPRQSQIGGWTIDRKGNPSLRRLTVDPDGIIHHTEE